MSQEKPSHQPHLSLFSTIYFLSILASVLSAFMLYFYLFAPLLILLAWYLFFFINRRKSYFNNWGTKQHVITFASVYFISILLAFGLIGTIFSNLESDQFHLIFGSLSVLIVSGLIHSLKLMMNSVKQSQGVSPGAR